MSSIHIQVIYYIYDGVVRFLAIQCIAFADVTERLAEWFEVLSGVVKRIIHRNVGSKVPSSLILINSRDSVFLVYPLTFILISSKKKYLEMFQHLKNKDRSPLYICVEGIDGVGKTTQVERLVEFFESHGLSVLSTREPGTPHLPITMTLRNFMLNNEFKEQLTMQSREYISQAIRSIHVEKLIKPTLARDSTLREYDIIIQDRGALSGVAYGKACGNDAPFVEAMAVISLNGAPKYSCIILLTGDPAVCLNRGKTAKKEFTKGDFIEDKGIAFQKRVQEFMRFHALDFTQVLINIDTEKQYLNANADSIAASIQSLLIEHISKQ